MRWDAASRRPVTSDASPADSAALFEEAHNDFGPPIAGLLRVGTVGTGQLVGTFVADACVAGPAVVPVLGAWAQRTLAGSLGGLAAARLARSRHRAPAVPEKVRTGNHPGGGGCEPRV